MKLYGLSYKTIYKSKGEIGKFNLDGCACFARIFNRIKDDDLNSKKVNQSYSIYVDITSELAKSSYNNYCILDLKTIKRYLRALQILVPFKWKITEDRWNDYNLLRIDINANITGFQHKFLLTYVRHLYEFPYNVILYDAYKLKNLSEYKFESITNLYQLCALLYPGSYGDGHALKRNAKHCTNKKLIKILKSRRTSLNSILETYSRRVGDLGNVPYSKTEYWMNENDFKDRLEKYNKLYKEWKKESM